MKTESAKKLILSELFTQPIHWEIDVNRFLWLRASSSLETLHIKINPAFPDGSAYSLVLADGTEITFDDFPKAWSRPPLKWPDSAKR